MAIALANGVQFTSTTGSTPSTITQTITTTTAGTLLLFAVVATSNSVTPTIASPGAGWTAIYSVSKATLAHTLFAYYNNPGSMGSLTCNLSNTTGGGASCAFAEVIGLGTGQALDAQNSTSGSGSSLSLPTLTITKAQEVLVYAVATALATPPTFTASNSTEWSLGSHANGASTNGNINAGLSLYVGVEGSTQTTPTGGGTLSAAAANYIGYADILHSGATTFGGGGGGGGGALPGYPVSPAGGVSGTYVPIFYGGTIGG